jgi:hypothetical protein
VRASVRFSTYYTGSVFQWLKNGLAIPGGRATELIFDSLTAAQYGSYQCQIGPFTSRVLTVTSSPVTAAIPGERHRAGATGGGLQVSRFTGTSEWYTLDGKRCGPKRGAAGIYFQPTKAGTQVRTIIKKSAKEER